MSQEEVVDMIKTFTVENTNEAMYPIYSWLDSVGVTTHSRGGDVLRAPCPVGITYLNPMQKVNFCSVRDANPFFHLLESIWMVAGSNDLGPLEKLLPSFSNFSDDGKTLNAAYGFRARRHFGIDQLNITGSMLRNDPMSRQAVVQLWQPWDLIKQTKDKACNTQLLFAKSAMNDTLEMTVINRSNDAIWGGVSGANVVHLPYLFEIVAKIAGMEPGVVQVFSNNLHIYTDNPKAYPLLNKYREYVPSAEIYYMENLTWEPILKGMESPDTLQMESQMVLDWIKSGQQTILRSWTNQFIGQTVIPMMQAAMAHRDKYPQLALKYAGETLDNAWRLAALNWLNRRYEK